MRTTQLNVLLLALLGAMAVVVSFWLRAHYPSPGFIAEPADQGWKVKSIARNATQGGLPESWEDSTLTKVCAADAPSQCVTLEPSWMTDGPTVPDASGIRTFVESQQALLSLASKAGQQVVFHARSAEGDSPATATVTLRNAREFMNDRYGLLLIVAMAVYSVGCALLAYVRRTRQVWLAFAMCAGFFVYMLARSWYTTRTWAQPALGWWIAIYVFRAGVLLCGTSTVFTLWNVRFQRRGIWLPVAVCTVIPLVVLAHSVGWIESSGWGYRYPTLGYFLIVAGISAHGWLTSPSNPGDRLRSRAFDIILLMGFAPLMVTMPLWTFRPDINDIIYLHNAALGLASIPGVVILARANYYHLHTLWWRLWLVLATVALALVGAAVLMLSLGMSVGTSLLLMLILSSWLVYLLRSWLEKSLIGITPSIERLLPQLLGLQALQGPALEHGWRALLVSAFAPQSMELVSSSESSALVTILRHGDGLVVPGLGQASALKMLGASQFTRTFGLQDQQLASRMHALAQLGLKARSAFVAGAEQERVRIAADLHDDIGGKLLHLASVGGDEGRYASNTLEDLRTITRGLATQPRTLQELLADIHFQLRERAERVSLDLQWRAQLSPEIESTVIGPRQCTLLVSICSELLRNAMQHESVTEIQFGISAGIERFDLECSNDGRPTEPSQWISGLGTSSIRRRVHDMRGQCEWRGRLHGGVVFSANWAFENWLNAGRHPEFGSFDNAVASTSAT